MPSLSAEPSSKTQTKPSLILGSMPHPEQMFRTAQNSLHPVEWCEVQRFAARVSVAAGHDVGFRKVGNDIVAGQWPKGAIIFAAKAGSE